MKKQHFASGILFGIYFMAIQKNQYVQAKEFIRQSGCTLMELNRAIDDNSSVYPAAEMKSIVALAFNKSTNGTNERNDIR